jgi:hypothetical protein
MQVSRTINRIESKVEDIAKVFFYPLPTRPTNVARAMRSGRAHVVIDADGRVYTSEISQGRYWTPLTRVADTVNAMMKMGMLSKAAVEQHIAAHEQEKQARERRYASTSVMENAERAGIKLTKAQTAKLEAAQRRSA